MKRKVIIITILILLTINSLAYGSIKMEYKSKAYLLGDYETGQILESYNIDTPIEIASISKLLSYFVIMDKINDKSISYDDKIIIDKDTASIKGSSYKVKVGEEFTLEELLKASIVVSGNDATYAIAKHISGTEEEFVKLMKNKAMKLRLYNSEIYNSTGLPVKNSELQNKMTTREIFILTKKLLECYPEVLELSKLPFLSAPSRGFLGTNTNPLLRSIEGIDGLKTGYTGKAGYCYVTTLNIKGEEKITEDLRLIGIVMGSDSYDERTETSKALVQYGKDNFSKQILVHEDLILDSLNFPKGDPMNIEIYPVESYSQLIDIKSEIRFEIDLYNNELPIKENEELGTVTVFKDNEPLFITKVINKELVAKASFYTQVSRFYEGLFKKAEEVLSIY